MKIICGSRKMASDLVILAALGAGRRRRVLGQPDDKRCAQQDNATPGGRSEQSPAGDAPGTCQPVSRERDHAPRQVAECNHPNQLRRPRLFDDMDATRQALRRAIESCKLLLSPLIAALDGNHHQARTARFWLLIWKCVREFKNGKTEA
jgi:hypothetical protein